MTLICQDTDSKVPLNITWSFQGTSGDFVLFENGLAPNLSENKYKLSNAATKLQINKLCANDTGKYICCIRGKHGETILSATALLTVEALSRNGRPANNLHPVTTAPSASASNPKNSSNALNASDPVSAANPSKASNPATTGHSGGMPSLSHGEVPTPLNKLQPSPTVESTLPTTVRGTTSHPVLSALSKNPDGSTLASQGCGNLSDDTATAVAFNENETSPSLMMIKEEGRLKLQCSYCVKSSNQAVSLFWYKENQVIQNSSHYVITNHGKDLGISVVQQRMDEGLYRCEVVSNKQNISKLITVIVKKAESNPLLSSVFAQNKSYLSVQVTWSLTEHAVFSACRVSLKLRLLNSSSWSQEVTNVSQILGSYTFEHLQPRRAYLLNITLYNKDQQTENRAMVFWSAASNSSEFDQRLLLLYRVINRRTLGVALGIMGLLGIIMITYVCVSWCHSDKRGYSIPPSQTKRQDEDDLLFQTDTHLFYNRAFDDDKSDWMDQEL